MAKNSGKSGGTSRIKIVMVEAEIAEGDVGAFTSALQNVLRGPSPTPRLGAPANGKAAALTAEPTDIEAEAQADLFEEEEAESAPSTARPRGTRKPARSPNVVDIEMNEDVSLEAFAQGKDSKSQHKKFLIAAAWLKEHRNIEAVTGDHIYTCFRSIGWSTNIPDFAQPLRDLKARKYLGPGPDKGQYAINHLGLDYVKKLGGNGAG
jgi:hypothetical protein